MSAITYPITSPLERVSRAPWLVFWFLAVVVFLVCNDISHSTKGPDFNPSENDIVASVGEGSLNHRVGLLALGLFAIVTLVRNRRDARLHVKTLGRILLGFVAWSMLSIIWTEDFDLTLRRLVVFGIFCIAAAAIASRFSARDIVLWTVFVTALFLLVGISAELFLGTFRPFTSGYRFAGTIDPNNQGVNCALLLLSGLTATRMERHRRTLFRMCALAGSIFLVLSASRTSFAAALVAVATYFAFVCSTKAKIAIAFVLSVTFCFLLIAFGSSTSSNLRSALLLGRDDSGVDSFHGRSGIWDDVGYYIARRPVLGYGYGSFWTPAHISEVSNEEKWGVPNAHSAYVDYLLSLGAVGLFAYLISLFGGIRLAIQFHKRSHNPAFAFCCALLVFCALDGLLESAVVNPSLLMFLNCVVLAFLAFGGTPHSRLVQHAQAVE
jgi:exopolysaccharide production protein ExoQ